MHLKDKIKSVRLTIKTQFRIEYNSAGLLTAYKNKFDVAPQKISYSN